MRNDTKYIVGFLIGMCIAGSVVTAFVMSRSPAAPEFTPSQILRFQPVCEGSDPNLVRIAQAELCRHGIECKIDSEFGKQTAFGQCKLFVMIQNGYEVKTIYEKR